MGPTEMCAPFCSIHPCQPSPAHLQTLFMTNVGCLPVGSLEGDKLYVHTGNTQICLTWRHCQSFRIYASTEFRHAGSCAWPSVSLPHDTDLPSSLLWLLLSSTSHFLILSPPPSVSINHSRAAPVDLISHYVNMAANPSSASLTPTLLHPTLHFI